MLNKETLLKIFEKYKNASTGGIYMTKWDAMADDILSSQNSGKPIVSSTFAVGKKVKVEHCFYGHEFDIGEVVSIVEHEAEKATSWLCTNGKASWWLSELEANCC